MKPLGAGCGDGQSEDPSTSTETGDALHIRGGFGCVRALWVPGDSARHPRLRPAAAAPVPSPWELVNDPCSREE